MKDRVLGPLTMVQFIYAVIGFGCSYAIYSAIPKPFSYILITPIAVFVICLDFIKINERPFLDFFKAAIAYVSQPKKRVWHQGDDSDLRIEIYHVEKKGTTVQHKNVSHDEISNIAKKYDTGKVLIKQ